MVGGDVGKVVGERGSSSAGKRPSTLKLPRGTAFVVARTCPPGCLYSTSPHLPP